MKHLLDQLTAMPFKKSSSFRIENKNAGQKQYLTALSGVSFN
ncbi:hypothetical protein ANHS_383 [Ligilactobacillus ruminis ATCC 25644]|nr:hypothetical protein ANHS_383 [Ligilactobacillus ruminis ATCC 25644]